MISRTQTHFQPITTYLLNAFFFLFFFKLGVFLRIFFLSERQKKFLDLQESSIYQNSLMYLGFPSRYHSKIRGKFY